MNSVSALKSTFPCSANQPT